MFIILFICLICCSLPGKFTSALTLEERDTVMWASSDYENDTSIRNATIIWSDEAIADLKFRLNNTRQVTPPLNASGFTYGFNTKVLKNWTDYWRNKYNFTERLAKLNKYPLKETNIQGLNIIYYHVKSEVNGSCPVLPLLLLHGFPGSIVEFQKTIPYLTAGCVNGIAFEVIIPCLPGFGYSDAATRPGLGSAEMGTIFKNLMQRIGFNQFYVQGGDYGGIIGSMMATLYPKGWQRAFKAQAFSLFWNQGRLCKIFVKLYGP